MSNKNSILVLGAGELGMAMLRTLARHAELKADVSIAVLLRPSTIASSDPEKTRDVAKLRSLGIEFVEGDLAAQTDDELATIFTRFDTVVSCTGFVGGRGVQLKLARAALAAGVKRYFPWQFGVDYEIIGRGSAQDLFDEQLDVRELLRSQTGTEWVIVSTGMFTSFLFERSFGVVDLAARTVNALGSWENAVTVTTPEDIAALTAEILFAEPRISNQVIHVAGDTVTYRKVADTVDEVLGIKVRRDEWTVPDLIQQWEEKPQDALRKYRVVFAQGRGVAWDMAGTFNAQRNIRVCGLDEWARGNLSSMSVTAENQVE
jgi:NmrA-like family